jgi:hypothetical protein
MKDNDKSISLVFTINAIVNLIKGRKSFELLQIMKLIVCQKPIALINMSSIMYTSYSHCGNCFL